MIPADGDQDDDGLPDASEVQGDHDGDGVPNHLDPDADDDGLSDGLEGVGDCDADGLPDAVDVDPCATPTTHQPVCQTVPTARRHIQLLLLGLMLLVLLAMALQCWRERLHLFWLPLLIATALLLTALGWSMADPSWCLPWSNLRAIWAALLLLALIVLAICLLLHRHRR